MPQYKTVAGPVGLTISQNGSYSDAVKQYADIINREATNGWKLDCIYEIPVTRENGCLGALFGQGNTTVRFNMLVFVRETPEGDHSAAPYTAPAAKPITSRSTSSYQPATSSPAPANGWRCSCGRDHANYESSCVCGVTKWQMRQQNMPKVSAEIKDDEKICPKCGTAQRKDRKVCFSCGQPFDN